MLRKRDHYPDFTWCFTSVALVICLCFGMSGCGYNTIQQQDEAVKAHWSEVVNQYQRRADLVPNLVQTVKGYAAHEQEVFEQVTKARAQIGSIQVTPDLYQNGEQLQKFQEAQAGMSSALSRLLAISESYPQLKADGAFRDLQAQLEGTENRIAVARNRYIQSIRDFNVTVRSFPSNITAKMFGFETRPNFTVEDEKAISKPPMVTFAE